MRSMRESGGYGLGHEPVVQMCPQKWNASASSGFTAAATADPPATRERRRSEPAEERHAGRATRRASPQSARPARSSRGCRQAAAWILALPVSSERLELLERVDASPSPPRRRRRRARRTACPARSSARTRPPPAPPRPRARPAPGARARRRRRSAGDRGGRSRRRRRPPRRGGRAGPSSAGAAPTQLRPLLGQLERHARADPHASARRPGGRARTRAASRQDNGRERTTSDDRDQGVGGRGDVDSRPRTRRAARAAVNPPARSSRWVVWPSEAPKQPHRSRSTPRRRRAAERGDEHERRGRLPRRRSRASRDRTGAGSRRPLRRHDAPRRRRRGPRGHAVGGEPVGKILPATQLGRRGPEQQKADDDPGDSRQLNHCRS